MPGFDLVIIGASHGPRHDSLVETFRQETGRAPLCLSWHEAATAPERVEACLHESVCVRFDSPDRDWASVAALYRAGADAAEAAGYRTLGAGDMSALAQGDIGSPAQLVFGMAAVVATVTARARGARLSLDTPTLVRAFDKTACLTDLSAAGIPVPAVLPPVAGFDALEAAMAKAAMSRVFVKLRHGSAAAGIIALARQGEAWRATTTAVLSEGRLRATPAVQQLNDRQEIAKLVDRLAPLGLHAEAWLPKIGIGGLTADLRLIVIGGDHVYPILRRSRHPMTNLHIGGRRGSADALIARIGDTAWTAVLETARRTAARFAASHSVGIDLAVLNDGRRHAVLEVNVFGDHVKDVTVDGVTPHQAQIRHIQSLMERSAVQAL